jgi:hypothetical protein
LEKQEPYERHRYIGQIQRHRRDTLK